MRVFVTGGTGFIGGRLIRKLRDRGDQVAALVRSPSTATALRDLGCELVEGGLSDVPVVRAHVEGCDGVIHAAGTYRIGIPESERPAMYATNVTGTAIVLDAAIDTGVPRIVHVSTVNAFGNTRSKVVDETYRRPPDDPYLSYYDQTKTMAHRIAEDRISRGGPVLIAQPGGVYGVGDHSLLGSQIEQTRRGTLRFVSFPKVGFNAVHVDDAADGLILILDRGAVGRSYVLGGELTTLGDAIRKVAALAGRRPPRFTMPTVLIRMSLPLAGVVTRVMGLPPNLREMFAASEGVTYWATDARARSELGYAPRDLETGLRDLEAAA